MKDVESIDTGSVAKALSEVAGITSEALELAEIIDRAGTSVRRAIPFDTMSVVRIVDRDHVDQVVLDTTAPSSVERVGSRMGIPLSSWSPRWRPRPERYPRIADAQADLDPTFPMDAEVLERKLGSGLWEPFLRGRSFAGGVWLFSCATHAYGGEHQEVLKPIAALLGAAVEHWRMGESVRLRRERFERVEMLLGTLAESLDVREVFQRLSAELQPILPHHLMNLTELDLRARTIRIAAYAGECDLPIRTDVFPLTEREVEDHQDFAILADISTEIAPDTERHRLILSSGLRSWLHVPLWLSGVIKGSLSFLHREPSRYDQDDAEVALLVAARVALTLSHQRLAEEARLATAARERAERLEARVETLARELEERDSSRIVGVSRSWRETLRQVGRVATSDTTVLITGESGTGKEVISKLIHQGSSRADRPFVAINCAALPEQLLESELFGHERGAFTGAVAMKIGRLEQAEGGTLFLDEIGEMSPQMQPKLLRVLEEREFQRVGGTRTLKADVRVIAATNRDLAAAMERQEFREDLYYRLNVFHIPLAPLRERPEDILPLAEAFLQDLGRSMGRPEVGFSRNAREWLMTHRWPGNVRELRNAVERAILLCDGSLITREHLPSPIIGARRAIAPDEPAPAFPPIGGNVDLGAMEKELIERALGESQGNKSMAARLLGLTRAQLYTRLQKHGIT